jgi:hypothetical protein
VKAAEFVVRVRCLHCRHKSVLSNEDLEGFGIKPDAPLASFIKRLRCTNCRSGSVLLIILRDSHAKQHGQPRPIFTVYRCEFSPTEVMRRCSGVWPQSIFLLQAHRCDRRL